MYEPKDRENPEYFTFRHVNGKLVPGYGPLQVAIVACVVVIFLVIFLATGTLETTTTKNLTQPEISQQLSEYKQVRNQIYSIELEGSLASINYQEEGEAKYVFVDNDPEIRKEILTEAKELRITGQMSDSDLETLVPKTKEVTTELIPMFLRLILFIIAPVMITASAFFEFYQGFTILKELQRWISWRREQQLFRYRASFGSEV